MQDGATGEQTSHAGRDQTMGRGHRGREFTGGPQPEQPEKAVDIDGRDSTEADRQGHDVDEERHLMGDRVLEVHRGHHTHRRCPRPDGNADLGDHRSATNQMVSRSGYRCWLQTKRP